MKTTYARLLSVLSSVAISSSVLAAGSDSSAYQGALFNGDSTKEYDIMHSGGPRILSIGISAQQQKRAVETGSGFMQDMKANHLLCVLGVDVTKWLTVYGGAGEADTATERDNSGANFEWLAGGTIRVLDYMVLEPWNDIDQYSVGVDFNSFYRNTSMDTGFDTSDISEIFGSLTLNFYTCPERQWLWNRLGFYVGPAFSTLSISDGGSSKGFGAEDQSTGFIGGLQLNPNPNMGLKLEVQKFDDLGLGASFMFHF